MDDASDFYLDVAGRAAKALGKLKGTPRIKNAPAEEGFRRSSHYRHAVICIVFSAVAVEHSMKRLMYERIARSGPPYSRLLVSTWKTAVNGDDRKAFLKGATRIDAALQKQIQRLFDDRNEIMHLGLKMKMKTYEHAGLGHLMEYPHFVYPTLRPDRIPRALANYKIAKVAVGALRAAIQEDEWWPVAKPWQKQSTPER